MGAIKKFFKKLFGALKRLKRLIASLVRQLKAAREELRHVDDMIDALQRRIDDLSPQELAWLNLLRRQRERMQSKIADLERQHRKALGDLADMQ